MNGVAVGLHTAFWQRMLVGYRDVLAAPDAAYERSVQLVRVTYAAWTYFAVTAVRTAPTWIDEPPGELLWPVAWMTALPWTAAVVGVVAVFGLGSLAATLVPTSVVARSAAFVGILTAEALKYSYDKINHGYHLWVLAALLLILLPRGDRHDPGHQRSYLEIAWGIQAVILATYTLAGLQKLWGAAQDLFEDGYTVFGLDSLALQVAKVQLRGGDQGVLAQFIVDHRTLGGILMLGGLAIELLALSMLFRPRAQRIAAVGFIALHLGIGLVLNVWFEAQILIVAVWLIGNPFVVGRPTTFATLHELPWIGPMLSSSIAARSGDDRMTVHRPPGDDVLVPPEALDADVAELGLPSRVRYAVRHEVGDASVLLVGRRARAWAEAQALGTLGARSRLLLPTFLLPPATAPSVDADRSG